MYTRVTRRDVQIYGGARRNKIKREKEKSIKKSFEIPFVTPGGGGGHE